MSNSLKRHELKAKIVLCEADFSKGCCLATLAKDGTILLNPPTQSVAQFWKNTLGHTDIPVPRQSRDLHRDIKIDDSEESTDVSRKLKLTASELAVACNISRSQALDAILDVDKDGEGSLDEVNFKELKHRILQTNLPRQLTNLPTMAPCHRL